MLPFTCGRQRCSHSSLQSSGTLLPHTLALMETGWVAPTSPLARRGLPQGLQGRSTSEGTAVKGRHWLSKRKIIRQPVPNPCRGRGHTDTLIRPPCQPQGLQLSPRDAGSCHMRERRTLSIVDSSQQKGDNLNPAPSCQPSPHFAPKEGRWNVKKPGIEGIGQ